MRVLLHAVPLLSLAFTTTTRVFSLTSQQWPGTIARPRVPLPGVGGKQSRASASSALIPHPFGASLVAPHQMGSKTRTEPWDLRYGLSGPRGLYESSAPPVVSTQDSLTPLITRAPQHLCRGHLGLEAIDLRLAADGV
jgi:hypothetical protein